MKRVSNRIRLSIWTAIVLLAPAAFGQLRQRGALENSGPPVVRYVPGSTTKLQQLLGEYDKELHRKTLNETVTRYGLQGCDLGNSFAAGDLTYFLFGDTVGVVGKARDSFATTGTRDPENGVQLDFLSPFKGTYFTIDPPGISMGAFEVPVSGITLGDRMYIVVSTNHSQNESSPTDRSVLTKFIRSAILLNPSTFEPLRTISQLPAGHFVKMSMHTQPERIAGLPPGGPYVLIWGTGRYRHSDAYLSIVPVANFERGKGTLYFSGLDGAGAPIWKPSESASKAIVSNGTMGDLSVTWCKDLRLWLMTYDSRPPAALAIQFSYSRTPWGPWSKPQAVFDANRDGGYGKFIHDPAIHPDDGLEGPVIGKGQANPAAVKGGAYAPYVVERWTKVRGHELNLYFLLSTWNPYVVMLMRSRFRVE